MGLAAVAEQDRGGNLATQQVYRRDLGRPKVEAIAERLRSNVETARSDALRITISVGYASLADGDFKTPESLFDAADAAMYSAKEGGRNRVADFRGRRAEDLPRRTSRTTQ